MQDNIQSYAFIGVELTGAKNCGVFTAESCHVFISGASP